MNVHSQCGEDGVIEYLLGLAGVETGYFVEFGAWDGKHLSNSAWLAEKGWSGCFIEGDTARFQDLLRNYEGNQNVAKLNAYVGSSGQNSLDALLRSVDAPVDVTVLSIDIDGNDYHVWEALKDHSALLCVIEFNPTIPAHVGFVQDNEPTLNFGNSLAALWDLGRTKGYSLVAATDWNGFFMPQSVCEKFGIPTYSPEQVKSRKYEAAIFHGYNGKIAVGGETSLVWHGVQFDESDFQILPSVLQELPAGQSPEYYAALDTFKASRNK